MRRGLAALVMGLSLMLATASWAGFILSRTVLDPGGSERLADHLLENPEVRDTIAARLADAIEGEIPPEFRSEVERSEVDQAAETALDDPRIEAVIRDGIVRSHQNALNGVDEPVVLDATAIGGVVREFAVEQRPELDRFLPAEPPVNVEVPSTGLSWLGAVKDAVDRFTLIGALVSLTGITIGFWLSRNRAATLRRVAYWAFGASAFWILVAFAIPAVLEAVAPSSVAIATAAIDVFLGAMITPAVTLALIGLGLLVLSLLWPSLARRVTADQRDRRARPAPAAGGRGLVGRPAPPHPAGPPVASPAPLAAAQTMSAGHAGPSAAPSQAPGPPPAPRPPAAPDKTQVFPQVISNHQPTPPVPPAPAPPPEPPPVPPSEADTIEAEPQLSWIAGVGYVDEAEENRRTERIDRGPSS